MSATNFVAEGAAVVEAAFVEASFVESSASQNTEAFAAPANAVRFNGKWKLHLRSAKIAWSRLSDDELLASEGQQDRLISLVQERYALSSDEATRRVTNFLSMRDC